MLLLLPPRLLLCDIIVIDRRYWTTFRWYLIAWTLLKTFVPVTCLDGSLLEYLNGKQSHFSIHV
jgi:hypothetical protein